MVGNPGPFDFAQDKRPAKYEDRNQRGKCSFSQRLVMQGLLLGYGGHTDWGLVGVVLHDHIGRARRSGVGPGDGKTIDDFTVGLLDEDGDAVRGDSEKTIMMNGHASAMGQERAGLGGIEGGTATATDDVLNDGTVWASNGEDAFVKMRMAGEDEIDAGFLQER